jgi:hypothetical protein
LCGELLVEKGYRFTANLSPVQRFSVTDFTSRAEARDR